MKTDYSDIFLAVPEAVVSCSEIACYSDIYNTELSEPLGCFLVRPIKKLKFFHNIEGVTTVGIATVGYSEINTKKKLITRTFLRDKNGNDEVYQHDVLANVIPCAGDISWMVDELHPAIETLGVEGIQHYLGLPKADIYERLCEVRDRAMELSTCKQEVAKQKKK